MTAQELPRSADCVIVGGGVVGCSLAYHLTKHGIRPLVVERGELGSGSTSKGAGGFRQQFSTEINVRVGIVSRRLLERFGDELGQPSGLHQIGYLFLATSDEEARQFAANVEMQQRVGLSDVRSLSIDEVRALVPDLRTDDVTAATFCPSDGIAGPNDVTAGYAAGARRGGATIAEGCSVTEILTEGGRVTGVVADGATISTPMVVDCAGAYAGKVGEMAGVTVPVKPYRRHIFITEQFSLSVPPPMTVDFATSFYFHPEGDGLLLGMSDPDEPSSFDITVAWDFLEHLVEHATWRLPALANANIKTGWAGLYEVSPDHQAIVGESPDVHGFWMCCGFSGHGFMQAPAIGYLLADVMSGKTPEVDITPFSPLRFAAGALAPETAVI